VLPFAVFMGGLALISLVQSFAPAENAPLWLAEPKYWQGHYPRDAANLSSLLHFGLADRIRYYWPLPQAEAAVGDLARQRGLMRFASRGPFVGGTAVAIIGSAIAYLASPLLSPAVSIAICLAMLTLPAMAAMDVIEGFALLKSWKRLAYGLMFIVRPLLIPSVFLGAWMMGVRADAALAVIAVAAATWVAAFLLIILVRRKIRTSLPGGPVVSDHRIWLRAGLPVMLIDGAFLLMTSTDIILMAVFTDDFRVLLMLLLEFEVFIGLKLISL
jgi:hypothetical protein